jgi:hypothetical protein
MTTFDLAEVRKFATELNSRMDQCDNGEGMECATLDAVLRYYARTCCQFREEVRRWGREVFAGRVAFDPAVEKLWLEEGIRLISRASAMYDHGEKAEGPCHTLEGQRDLGAALYDFYQLLTGWVTPKRGVGPSARHGLPLDSATAERVSQRIAFLPPLPANWQPNDLKQRAVYRKKLRTS